MEFHEVPGEQVNGHTEMEYESLKGVENKEKEGEAIDAAAGSSNREGSPSDGYHSALEDQPHSLSDIASSLCRLLYLPSELIDHIVAFLSPRSLDSVSWTCRRLREHAMKDHIWQQHVQDNVPGCRIKSPAPCATYRDLYYAHDPHWFLSKYKIWFCDHQLTGKLVIARYDPRRGCIEGYRMVAGRAMAYYEPWEIDDEVIIHSFEPHAHLHTDQPILQLNPRSPKMSLESREANWAGLLDGRWHGELPMPVHDLSQRGTFSNFILTRAVKEYENMQLWPPQIIPAHQRVRNASQEGFFGSGHKPSTRSEVCENAFRIRKWMQMLGGAHGFGATIGEEVHTYATLDPVLYTPTAEKPFRGIWVGDYSGHGCEFLLMHQPDDDAPFDESSIVQFEDEALDEFLKRRRDAMIYRGRIEAIKLTGDPNVPRGEFTFIVPDVGENGLVRVATEERFRGARIVHSQGHIAERMFRNDKYIETQLIMISPDRLAQYWVGFGHISFYVRVNIDGFLSPYNDRHFRTV